MVLKENSIQELFSGLGKVRGQKRTDLINKCSRRFYLYLKNNGYNQFTRDLLKSYFPNEIKPTALKTQVRSILSILESEQKIVKNRVEKVGRIFFRIRTLYCEDRESFYLLMKANGYKVRYFNWTYDKVKKCPKKVIIQTLEVNERPNFDFEGSELISRLGVKNQKCLTNSPLSVQKCKNKYSINSYIVN